MVGLTPHYFWAQNISHVQVKIDVTNSPDTSACDQALVVNKHVDHEGFIFSIICAQSTLLIRYHLTVKTFMPLNYHFHSWKPLEQNGWLLESMKSPNPYFWKSLHSKQTLPKRKPKIWWKMLERYKEQLKDYMHDL